MEPGGRSICLWYEVLWSRKGGTGCHLHSVTGGVSRLFPGSSHLSQGRVEWWAGLGGPLSPVHLFP